MKRLRSIRCKQNGPRESDGIPTAPRLGKMAWGHFLGGIFMINISRIFAISFAAALGLATLPVEVSAKEFSVHGFHHGLGPRLYGDIVAGYVLGDQPYTEAALPVQIRDVPSPAPAPSCHHSRETVPCPRKKAAPARLQSPAVRGDVLLYRTLMFCEIKL